MNIMIMIILLAFLFFTTCFFLCLSCIVLLNELESENDNNICLKCEECIIYTCEDGISSYISENEYSPGVECSICLDRMEMKDIERLRCKHIFHRKCLSSWMDVNNVCPECRSKGCCVRIINV